MATDRKLIYLLVPKLKGDTWHTELKRAVIRGGPAGREDLIEIAQLLREKT